MGDTESKLKIDGMKIWKVKFDPMWPVGCCLIIAAPTEQKAMEIAIETIKHTDEFEVVEFEINEPCVIEYMSGEY